MHMRSAVANAESIYRALYARYGPQGWWPVTDRGAHATTYRKREELSRAQQFEVIVGAILTQSTAWKNVEQALRALRNAQLRTPERIANIPTAKLAHTIRSAGYHNQKAVKLKQFAKFLLANPLPKLERMPIGDLRDLLLAQHGIGPETADSIILYAFSKPSFVIDAYTRRIFARLEGCERETPYHAMQQQLAAALPNDATLFNEYHALLVAHAKQHCRKTPVCEDCPLHGQCARGENSAASTRIPLNSVNAAQRGGAWNYST